MVDNAKEAAHVKDAAAPGHNGVDLDNALINRLAREREHSTSTQLLADLAPQSAMMRYGTAGVQGLLKVPEGMGKAIVHDIEHPLETAGTLGMAAGTAFILKTVLPEGGMAGKLAGAAIGAYFTYQAAVPVYDGFKKAGNAVTMRDLNAASTQIGDAGGSFVVNSAIAAVGYKLGSNMTDRFLSSKPMDGFADMKANFYDGLGKAGTSLTDTVGITTPAPKPIESTTQKAAGGTTMDPRSIFAASERAKPVGLLKGDVDPGSSMEVSVMLKSKASDLRVERTLARIAQGRQAPLADAELGATFGASQKSLDAVTAFAKENGLQVTDANLTSGRVVLKGTAGQFTEAFNTKLSEYEHASGVLFRGREGSLSIPNALHDHLTGVFGMDDRPQARSHVARFIGEVPDLAPGDPPGKVVVPRSGRALMPDEVADAYNFPKTSMGKGQAVGIIELGGGIDLVDNAQYYTDHNLPQPKINIIEVSGAKNSPGGAADGEVLLDSQVIGVVAPEATQNLIFAPNSEKGFVDAINRATFAEKGEVQNSAISISWGQNEEGWSKQAIDGMSQAFKKAALKGISIFAASGDDGALDNAKGGKWQVDYPASDPSVTGTGGTRLVLTGDGKIKSEVVWNNHSANDAAGGGVSEVFDIPDFQKSVTAIPHANTGKFGRMVPDITGNGDPVTGYIVRVNGSESPVGGTSAVSPLYSALMMRINSTLGKPVPALNQWLYANAKSGIFNDITVGDNNGYKAGPGYDAASGLGSVDGTKMLNLLQSKPHVETQFGNFRFVGPSAPAFTPFIGPAAATSGDLENRK